MMQDIQQFLSGQGMGIPPPEDLIASGIAAALAVGAIAIGWFVAHRYGTPIREFWKQRVGGHVEGVAARVPDILRNGIAAMLLAILINAWPWPNLGLFMVGLALGYTAAMFAVDVLRGLGLPRWSAWAMAVTVFVAILANALGGLDVITNTLDRAGVSIGRTRLSILSIVTIAITVLALFAAVRLINRVVTHSISQASGFDPAQKVLFQKLAGIAIIVVAFFFGIDLLGIDLTTFAVFSGAFGLAVGFGMQKTIGNLIAGIILLMDRSIKPGDVIVVGDSFGWVNKIGVRAVSVITRDGKEHLIPNENLMTQEVENWSYSDRNVRVRIPVGVSYACDLKLAQELMLRAAKESPRVLSSPKPNVWLSGYGDSSVDHEVLVWINDPEGGVGNVKSDVLNRLWWLFKEHGIEIPFPQRDVWVKGLPETK